jgi:hypothetical protein
MKKISIEKGLISFINHNVKAKCPVFRVVLSLDSMKIQSRPYGTSGLDLYDENGTAIGNNIVTRKSLIDAAKRALAENGIDYKEA